MRDAVVLDTLSPDNHGGDPVGLTEKRAMGLSLLADFRSSRKGGAKLCVMPVPRLSIDQKLADLDGFVFYPASFADLGELGVTWVPADEFAKAMSQRDDGIVQLQGNALEWFKCAATQLSIDDFGKHALIAFAFPANWELFLSGNHAYRCGLLQELSEHAETAMDVLRFDFCRLNLPDTLPGRAGTFGFDSPYTGALIYTQDDHESYIIGGQVITHQVITGIGLELACPPGTVRIGRGEVGNVTRRGLALFSAAMESNSLTNKFVQCMSLLEFLAFPDDAKQMKEVKREIAAHVAATSSGYQAVLDDIGRLTSSKDADDRQVGLRTCIVHNGSRLESLVPIKRDRDAIFDRLEQYIGKTLSDLIQLSDHSWEAVLAYRAARKPSGRSGQVPNGD